MFKYCKLSWFPIDIVKKDLKLAKVIVTQYGGPYGELGAALRYLNQRYTMPCDKGKALLNQRVGRLLPKKNLDGLFAYYALQKPLAELQNGTGATTVKHLSHGDIKKLVVSMPPTKKEQTAIAEMLSDMDYELEQFNQILVKYRLIRQGMMSELLTGRIRLVEQL